MKNFSSPFREYSIIAVVSVALGGSFLFPQTRDILLAAALLGSLPTFLSALRSLAMFRISIDVFNAFALAVAFWIGEIQSAAFIVLMLAFASILDWHTASRAHNAVKELLNLRPLKAFIEVEGNIKEVLVRKVKENDVVIIKNGERVPVDGIVIYGNAFINESSVTGESASVERMVGNSVVSSTLIESGMIKIRATRVGSNSTIERIAALIEKASKHKSHSEKLADKFAAIFLPTVLAGGIILYALTKNITMTAAFFLVACADDVAVAIPLAISAALGRAAKRGVIIKGGEWIETLSKVKTFVLDKTGTLTYGRFIVEKVSIEKDISKEDFWRLVGAAEKFSEHPIGKAIFSYASLKARQIFDPDEFSIVKGSGVRARIKNREITVVRGVEEEEGKRDGNIKVSVFLDNKFIGSLWVSDAPRREARMSVKELKKIGVKKILMFTGDRKAVASRISNALGIDSFYASMTPEDKLREIESLSDKEIVAMVGDGVNDTPALARANIGIAMGRAGTAIAIEAADVVVLNDDLSRIPELIVLSRRTVWIIYGDIIIWFISNIVGFSLVLAGVIGPALAAFYNFATDFLPLLNSARLFRDKFDK